MRHDLTVIAYEIHIGTKYIDIYRLCRYHDLFLGAIRGRPAFAAGFGSGEGCEPDLDPAPPDARQGDLFGAEPFDRRDGRQIYVSLLVLVVPLLPGEPASVAQPERRGAELRPFAAPVAGLRHRRDALSGELQPAKSMWPAALPIPKIPSPGCDVPDDGGRRSNEPTGGSFLDCQLFGAEFWDVMRAVFAVIGVAVAGAYGHQFDLFDAFADGEDQQRFVGQVEFLFDPLLVECADADAVQADLRCLEQHALGRDAQIHVDVAVLFDCRADDDKGIRLGTRKGQAECGHCLLYTSPSPRD